MHVCMYACVAFVLVVVEVDKSVLNGAEEVEKVLGTLVPHRVPPRGD